ncbi:tRNA (guanine(10)-N2)-methyltransferase homolog [Phymastichus coffea]|uniref:tRNA (guanine(10)-N2)-methyltransferase homolog n=1 Tax=Phymastichus coffea TaxID=108790 RepID=UPI00273AF534|nr:tRNA (guanine(10)-N2)-methyltransferase homolog [Phymastichus coffea]
MSSQWKKYLLWFAHEHVEFRIPEMDSIFSMFDITLGRVIKATEHPFWIVELPSEDVARTIASRSVLLRHCIELWAHSKIVDGLHANLKSYPQDLMEPYLNTAFKVVVETFCKHFTQREKVEKIETFNYLPLKGSVNLKNPDTTLFYIEYYGQEPNSNPENPEDLFFGRWIADGQRDKIQKLSLKSRKFIGNTSMDPQLSILMANQAQAKAGDIILDPFVGTGSLLIPASMFGAYTLGTDIDYLMLHARTRPSRISQKKREEDESIAANMKQYGVGSRFVDVIVSDFSREMWRPDIKLDAIITDPPYGIREAVERIGTAKTNPSIEEHQIETHIPSKVVYELWQLFIDLLNFSVKHLKLTGRLVFWFPVFRKQYSEDQLPIHPCLKLVADSEQILSTYTSRRLLTYEKVKEAKPDDPSCKIGEANFRDQYFNYREELRSVRRARKSAERLKLKEEWEKRKVTNDVIRKENEASYSLNV